MLNDIIYILKNLKSRISVFSISKKIALINFFMFALIISIFYSYNYFITYPMLRTHVEYRIDDIIRFVEPEINIAVDLEIEETLHDVLKKVITLESVGRVIIKKDGKLLDEVSELNYSKLPVPERDETLLFKDRKLPYFVRAKNLKYWRDNTQMIVFYSATPFLNTISNYKKFTFIVTILIFISITIFSIIIKFLLLPFTKLANRLKNLKLNNIEPIIFKNIKYNDEREDIIKVTNEVLIEIKDAFDVIEDLNKNLEKKVFEKTEKLEEKTSELEELNKFLKSKVDEEVNANREKDHILIQQSRSAAMGEMIGNIAHQWRQPINSLGLILYSIKSKVLRGNITNDKFEEYYHEARTLIEKMSQTIDNFRDFFKTDRIKKDFYIKNVLDDVISIVDASFKFHNINLIVNSNPEIKPYGYPNDLLQVLLNILTNAKDSILEAKKKDRRVEINIHKTDDNVIIKILDNGKGIDPNIADKIFNSYFSTKKENKGSGIGLYMSKVIVEKHFLGKIYAIASNDGAKFIIELPLPSHNK